MMIPNITRMETERLALECLADGLHIMRPPREDWQDTPEPGTLEFRIDQLHQRLETTRSNLAEQIELEARQHAVFCDNAEVCADVLIGFERELSKLRDVISDTHTILQDPSPVVREAWERYRLGLLSNVGELIQRLGVMQQKTAEAVPAIQQIARAKP